jgi:hypothetical protein
VLLTFRDKVSEPNTVVWDGKPLVFVNENENTWVVAKVLEGVNLSVSIIFLEPVNLWEYERTRVDENEWDSKKLLCW